MKPDMKRALVTGGSGGIGAAICRRLAADGCYVYVHANRNLAKAAAVVEEICMSGGAAEAIAFDVTDAEACRVVLEALVADAPIQILVNNAGVHDDAVFPGMRAGQWHSVLDVSLNGFFHVTQPLTLPMIRSRWGASSTSPPSPGWSAIAARSTMPPPRGGCTPPPSPCPWNWPAAASR